MLTLVIYDISENNSRSHLIKRLQHFGLHRVQKSAFLGILSLKERGKLDDDMDKYLSSDNDSIIIIPICESCRGSIVQFGEGNLSLSVEEEYRFV
ncbi:MAG: CRISPR-associated endonuclease Cas2 [Methanobacteriaceae archaeon]